MHGIGNACEGEERRTLVIWGLVQEVDRCGANYSFNLSDGRGQLNLRERDSAEPNHRSSPHLPQCVRPSDPSINPANACCWSVLLPANKRRELPARTLLD